MFAEEQYQKYFENNVQTESERRLLQALYSMYSSRVTATELARMIDVSSHTVVNAAIGRLGHKISDYIEIKPQQRKDGSYRWWTIVADGERVKGRMYWTLNEDLRSSFSNLHAGFFNQQSELLSSVEKYKEGSTAYVRIKRYERNPQARARCIEKWGARCSICDLEFHKRYGVVAEGFIHVHHILPIATIDAEYEIDPFQDLVPLCPNCHAVVHMRIPPYSVSEVKTLMGEVNKS